MILNQIDGRAYLNLTSVVMFDISVLPCVPELFPSWLLIADGALQYPERERYERTTDDSRHHSSKASKENCNEE